MSGNSDVGSSKRMARLYFELSVAGWEKGESMLNADSSDVLDEGGYRGEAGKPQRGGTSAGTTGREARGCNLMRGWEETEGPSRLGCCMEAMAQTETMLMYSSQQQSHHTAGVCKTPAKLPQPIPPTVPIPYQPPAAPRIPNAPSQAQSCPNTQAQNTPPRAHPLPHPHIHESAIHTYTYVHTHLLTHPLAHSYMPAVVGGGGEDRLVAPPGHGFSLQGTSTESRRMPGA